jgi:predicted ester cyclase
MITQSVQSLTDLELANKVTAARFVEAFNTDNWDTVREVVADNFVFHHPIGGTVQAGPEGMVATWAGFKHLSPDSWHPIPILIAEGDCVAVLLPTYGHFTGRSDQAPPPTGGRLDYGMVNIVRFEAGKLAEMWFGMDPLVELQQMGVAPASSPPPCGATAHADPASVYRHEITTQPPYGGDPSVDTKMSRAVVDRWFDEVLSGHDLTALAEIASPNILVHPTAMPCEAGHYGTTGVERWLGAAQWHARGTSQGDFLGVAPTGRSLDYTGLSMYRIENGRIAEIWETRNTMGVLHQLDPRIGGGHHH